MTDWQTRFEWLACPRIIFGPGELARLGELAAAFGGHAMLVTMADIPHVGRAADTLRSAGLELSVFDRCTPDPLAQTVDELAEELRLRGCDVLVALGGGSAMDTAKAASVLATNDGPAWEYTIEFRGPRREPKNAPLPVVAVPTTHGTGSEVNGIAVLSNAETRQKGPLRCAMMIPKVALLDPELTLTLPERQTRATAFDALTHAFERFFAEPAHPWVDCMAAHCIGTVVDTLPRLLSEPQNVGARAALLWTAAEAALCVCASLGEAGLHIFALAVAATLGSIHGESLAAMMPVVLGHLIEERPHKAAWFAHLLGADTAGLSVEQAAQRALPAMVEWMERVGMRLTLRDLGAREEHISQMAQSVNMARLRERYCKKLSEEQVAEVFRAAL